MDEQGSGKGVWIGLILALLAAVAFLLLWFMRGGEVDRLTRELSLAQSSAMSSQQRLESDLSSARNTASASARRVTELENRLADEQRRASDNALQLERRLRGEVDDVQSRLRAATRELEELRSAQAEAESAQAEAENETIRELRAEIEEYTATIEGLRADNDRLSSQVEEVEARARQAEEANADPELLDTIRTESIRLSSELRDAENTHNTLIVAREQARNELETYREEATRREEELRKTVEQAEADNARLRDELEALEATVRELQQDIDRLEGATSTDGASAVEQPGDSASARVQELTRENENLAARLAETEASLRQEIATLREERTELQNELAAALAQVRESASASAGASAAEQATDPDQRVTELRRELTARQERYLEERTTLQEEIRDLKARLEQRTPMSVQEEQSSAVDDSPIVSTPLGDDEGRFPNQFVTDDPYRSLGKIVMLEKDGRTYVVNAGARQNIRPGMRFDVHRKGEDGRSRYIGLVQVVRTLEDFAWVMSVNPGVVMVCPITGRAVLEPGAQFSPFVLTESGAPVPLRDCREMELPLDMPQEGDSIDNPFINPERPSTFAVSQEIEDALECALGAVCTLGGVAANAPESDFVIVAERSIFDGNLVGPKRVTLQHLLKYAAPTVVSCLN